jgi:hypothetical protein
MSAELNCVSFSANSVLVLSHAEFISIFANFKMAEVATSVKEPSILKQCCNPLNVSDSASSKENLRPVFDWTIIKVPSSQIGHRICDKYRKTLQICSKVLEVKQLSL